METPKQAIQVITNTKVKNKLVAKDYYEDTLKSLLPEMYKQYPSRKDWGLKELDGYIKANVGKQLIENEFYTGLIIDKEGKSHVKRKYTKKTLIANISKELKVPELALSYIYDELIESDLMRTKKEEVKEFVNINVENALNDVDISIMDANDPKDKAALFKTKIEFLRLYLESNEAISKSKGTTINNVTGGSQTNLSNSKIQNNQTNITDAETLNDVCAEILERKKQEKYIEVESEII